MVTGRTLALVCVLLTAPLTGCLSGQQRPENVSETDPSDPASASGFETRPIDGTPPTGNWSLLEVSASPDATLGGATLTVPEGAKVRHPTFGPFGGAVLEVVPLVPEADRDAVESWGVFAFPSLDEDSPSVSGVVSTTYRIRNRTTPVLQEEETVEPTIQPARLRALGVDEGDDLPIVLAAKTSRPVDLGVALRFLDRWPTEPLTEDVDEMVEEVAAQGTVPELPVIGTGEGFQVGLYLDFNSYGAFGTEAWTDSVQVQYELPVDPRPVASDRNLRLDYRFASEQGWGLGSAVEVSEIEATDWSISADVHGTTVEADGATVNAHYASSGLVTGFPVYAAMGEGPSGTTSTMEMTGAGTGLLQVLLASHIDLGATLQELIGEASPSITQTYDGLVADGDPTRVSMQDRSLRVDGPWSDLTVLGPWDRNRS